MSLLIEIKLKENGGKLIAKVKGIRGVGLIVPEPRTQDDDVSIRVIVDVKGCD